MQLKRLSLTLAALGLASAHALAYDYAHPIALSTPELSAGAPVLMEAVTSAGSDKVPAASEKAPVAAAATTAPATVPTEAPLPAFSAADIESLFVPSDAPMQLAVLSAQEMRETEGAWANFAIGGLAGGAIQAGGFIRGVHLGHHRWNTGRFIGNVATGAAFGATTGQMRFLASGVSGMRNLATPGGAIWAFNNTAGNWGFNHVWRR